MLSRLVAAVPIAGLLALPAVVVPAASSVPSAAPGCDPEVVDLGTLPGDEYSYAAGVNRAGWVVGTSGGSGGLDEPGYQATLWRDGAVEVIDVLTGWEPPDGTASYGTSAEAINRGGTVAVQRETYDGDSEFLARSFLWDEGARTRLRGLLPGGYARVTALNDRGTAVGTSTGSSISRPVRWRGGVAEPLRLPPLAESPEFAGPEAINSHGLVVGHVVGDLGLYAWAWRPDGTGHPLRGLHGKRLGIGDATGVDDQGRIVGTLSPRLGSTRSVAVVWPGRRQPPVPLEPRQHASATSGAGDVVGFSSSRRPYRGWVRHFNAQAPLRILPLPEGVARGLTLANDVTRGVSPLAPCGGVTVVGESGGRPSRATAWTRAYHQPQPDPG